MKTLQPLLILLFLMMRFTASAQTYCDTVFHIVPGSAEFKASDFSIGDSMLVVLITNISASQSMAYPTAGLQIHDALPTGMQLATPSLGVNTVFASSYVPGDTQEVRFYFDVTETIPYNYSVTFTLWADADNNNGPIDSCAVKDSFEVNLNPLFMPNTDNPWHTLNFSMYPVADAGILRVKGEPGLYAVYSIHGTVLQPFTLEDSNNESDIPLQIPPGVYILRNQDGNAIRFIWN
jgi:hypothetical protein